MKNGDKKRVKTMKPYWMPKIMLNQMKIQTQTQAQNEMLMWTQNKAEKKDANLEAKKE